MDKISESEKTFFNHEHRDIDKLILPSFFKLLNNKDIIIDFKDENSLNVSYSKKALKWLKDVKKKDPFWKEEEFILRVIDLAIKNIYEEESQKIIEGQKTEENNVRNTDETTNITISN